MITIITALITLTGVIAAAAITGCAIFYAPAYAERVKWELEHPDHTPTVKTDSAKQCKKSGFSATILDKLPSWTRWCSARD